MGFSPKCGAHLAPVCGRSSRWEGGELGWKWKSRFRSVGMAAWRACPTMSLTIMASRLPCMRGEIAALEAAGFFAPCEPPIPTDAEFD